MNDHQRAAIDAAARKTAGGALTRDELTAAIDDAGPDQFLKDNGLINSGAIVRFVNTKARDARDRRREERLERKLAVDYVQEQKVASAHDRLRRLGVTPTGGDAA